MIVLVCGGRLFFDERYVFGWLDLIHEMVGISMVVQGEAPGADTLSREWAQSRFVPTCGERARWKEEGPYVAGPLRNRRMLDKYFPELVIAFPGGSGTANMLRNAKEYSVDYCEV